MRLLLDSHTFLWFCMDNPQLSENAAELIEADENEKFLSVASIWEIAIKVSLGKLALSQPIEVFLPEQLKRNGIVLLPISLPHVLLMAKLPFHHRDPFDRMLAAQSLIETMPLLSIDTMMDTYGVRRFW